MPPAEAKNATLILPHLQTPVEQLWNLIIRPPRSRYTVDQLGPTHFRLAQRTFVRRTDVKLQNPRGHRLQCSFFEPLPFRKWEASLQAAEVAAGGSRRSAEARAARAAQQLLLQQDGEALVEEEGQERLPCIIFLHGNSSCRLEALPLVPHLMPLKICLFCFDFSGCGISDGDYISLGWFERDDLAVCIEYLRSSQRVSTIALWGRSMGAFTALLHADRDPSIAGLVLDSPFTSLSVLAQELARGYAKVPAWMVRAVLVLVRTIIQAKANFDIEHLNALEHVGHSFSPALFIAAHGDDFIPSHHAKELHEAYQGEKELYMIEGDHNSMRPDFCRKKAILFLCRAFHEPGLDRLLEMHTSGLFDIFAGASQKAPHSQESAGKPGDEGAAICQQMQVFPALRMMMLLRQRLCRRPFTAKTVLKLLEHKSEAGFFVRLEPVAAAESQGLPRFLLLTVSTTALIASRICDSAVETVAVGAGVPLQQSRQLQLSMDRAGLLRLRLGDDPWLEVACGANFREEASLWLLLLSGQTSFGTLSVDDSEATLREHLGDVLLQERHLGGGALARSPPSPLPRGDMGQPAPTLVPLSGPPPSGGSQESLEEEVKEVDRHMRVLEACAKSPEALIGDSKCRAWARGSWLACVGGGAAARSTS